MRLAAAIELAIFVGLSGLAGLMNDLGPRESSTLRRGLRTWSSS